MQISKSTDLKRKEVDDVLGGAESWKAAPKTTCTLNLEYLLHLQMAL